MQRGACLTAMSHLQMVFLDILAQNAPAPNLYFGQAKNSTLGANLLAEQRNNKKAMIGMTELRFGMRRSRRVIY